MTRFEKQFSTGSLGERISHSALPWHIDQTPTSRIKQVEISPTASARAGEQSSLWKFGSGVGWAAAGPLQPRQEAGAAWPWPPLLWWWLSLGLIPWPLICRVCTHFWFSWIRSEGVGMGYGNYVVGGVCRQLLLHTPELWVEYKGLLVC